MSVERVYVSAITYTVVWRDKDVEGYTEHFRPAREPLVRWCLQRQVLMKLAWLLNVLSYLIVEALDNNCTLIKL